ncbi:MAG: hypothetical protein QM756_32130 [Polyangiaceae bacterium]
MVLSREAGNGEVAWSLSEPRSWPDIAQAFGLPLATHARRFSAAKSGFSPGVLLLVIGVVVVLCILLVIAPDDGSTGSSSSVGIGSGSSYRGGGVFSGGK